MREAVIVSSVRTPVGKAYKGTLRATRPDDLAATAISGALARVPQLDKKEIEDVILGCAMPEAEQGMNVARIASLRAGSDFTGGGAHSRRWIGSNRGRRYRIHEYDSHGRKQNQR
jgi:acetyl-CoA acyltransferase